jgi:hypothetical protein
MQTDTAGKTWWDWALRVIALIGLVAILVLGAWGIIQLAFGLPDVLGGISSSVSSLFEKSPATTSTQSAVQTAAESINVTAPSLANSGQAFTLSWTHTGGTGQYAYQISYSCQSGLTLKAPLPTGALQSVPCNTPFNYTNATQSLMLTPALTGTKQVSAQFTVAAVALASNTTTTSGATSVTVLPPASTTGSYSSAAKTGTPAGKYISSATVATLYGLPNLTTTIVSATPTATGYSVEFLIRNTGTNIANAGWTFATNIPTSAVNQGEYNYTSTPQQALRPGDGILYTMGFSLPVTQSYNPYGNYSNYSPYTTPACGYTQSYTYNGYANYPTGTTYTCNNTSYSTTPYAYSSYYPTVQSYVFSVTADPQGYLAESSKADNTASVSL